MIFLALPQVPLTLGNHAYALHSGRHGRRGRAWAQRRHARICDQARLSQGPLLDGKVAPAHRSLDADSDDRMFGDLHGLKLRVAGTEQQLRVIMLRPLRPQGTLRCPKTGLALRVPRSSRGQILRFEQHAKTCGDKRACRHTDQGARRRIQSLPPARGRRHSRLRHERTPRASSER